MKRTMGRLGLAALALLAGCAASSPAPEPAAESSPAPDLVGRWWDADGKPWTVRHRGQLDGLPLLSLTEGDYHPAPPAAQPDRPGGGFALIFSPAPAFGLDVGPLSNGQFRFTPPLPPPSPFVMNSMPPPPPILTWQVDGRRAGLLQVTIFSLDSGAPSRFQFAHPTRRFDLIRDRTLLDPPSRAVAPASAGEGPPAGPPGDIERLTDDLGGGDWLARARAVRRLALHRPERAVPLLTKALGDECPINRMLALDSLGRLGDGAAVGPLLSAAAAPADSELRERARRALAAMGPQLAPDLARWMVGKPQLPKLSGQDAPPVWHVHGLIAGILVQWGRPALPAVAAVLDDCGQETTGLMLNGVLAKIGRPEASRIAADYLERHPIRLDDYRRQPGDAALEALASIADPSAVALLARYVPRERSDFRGTAGALVRIGPESAIPAVLSALGDCLAGLPGSSPRSAYDLAFYRAGPLQRFGDALRRLDEKDPACLARAYPKLAVGDLRAAVAAVFYSYARTDRPGWLDVALADSRTDHRGLREVSAGALGRAGDERAMRRLIEMLDDTDDNVVAVAGQALGHYRNVRIIEPLIRRAAALEPVRDRYGRRLRWSVNPYDLLNSLGRSKMPEALGPLVALTGRPGGPRTAAIQNIRDLVRDLGAPPLPAGELTAAQLADWWRGQGEPWARGRATTRPDAD